MNNSSRKVAGFTIIELMITLAIAAILASLAAPSFTDTIKNNRLSTQYNQLLTQINLAKSEAIKRGAEVKILSNDNGNWHSGWTVYEDFNNNDSVDPDETIRINDTIYEGITINFNVNGQIKYKPSGLGVTAGTFTICDDRGNTQAKALIISTTGRTRLAVDSDNDGIVEGGNNSNVSCS